LELHQVIQEPSGTEFSACKQQLCYGFTHTCVRLVPPVL
jgi:hypothetical protein